MWITDDLALCVWRPWNTRNHRYFPRTEREIIRIVVSYKSDLSRGCAKSTCWWWWWWCLTDNVASTMDYWRPRDLEDTWIHIAWLFRRTHNHNYNNNYNTHKDNTSQSYMSNLLVEFSVIPFHSVWLLHTTLFGFFRISKQFWCWFSYFL